MDECQSNRYRNACARYNATCFNTDGFYGCSRCSRGYAFNSSSHECADVDECRKTPSPCGSIGADPETCQNTPGSFWCKCHSGYAGQPCRDINECGQTTSPCNHGFRCENFEGSYKCVCPPGYTGNLCENDIDECQQSPCGPRANCTNTRGSFQCVCSPDFAGRFCERESVRPSVSLPSSEKSSSSKKRHQSASLPTATPTSHAKSHPGK